MSSSSQPFTLGGLDKAVFRPATQSVVTAAPFAVAPAAAGPSSTFQPIVFTPFDGHGKIVSIHEDEPIEEIAEEIEVAEAEDPPPPPPPDYEAIKAEAWREGFQLGYDEGLRLAAE